MTQTLIPSEDCILFDWLSITSKIHTPQQLISLLGLDGPGIQWEQGRGAPGYADALYWEHIKISYNGREDMGIWLEFTGQGCRAFESFGTADYMPLFQLCLDEPQVVHLTRLDVAYDDHSGILPIDEMADDTLRVDAFGISTEFVTRYRSRQVERTHHDGDPRDSISIYHGRKVSECMIRIYDKAAERKLWDQHWVRVELQLRDDRALEFVRLLDQGQEIGTVYMGVVHNYLRYVDPCPSDSNRWRWPLKSYWDQFLCGAGKISLWVCPGEDYNIMACRDFVYEQAGGAIYTMLEIEGPDLFMEHLHEARRGKLLNSKYQRLLAQYSGKCYDRYGKVLINERGESRDLFWGSVSTQQNKNFVEYRGGKTAGKAATKLSGRPRNRSQRFHYD